MSAGSREGAEMPFWDHLEQLRQTLFKALGLVGITAAALFAVMPRLVHSVLLAPCRPEFVTYRLLDSAAALASARLGWAVEPPAPFEMSLVNIKLPSQFLMHINLSFWGALVVAFPGLLWLLWQFVAPALTDAEKRGAAKAFGGGTLMFYLGAITGYLLVFPLTLRFLAGYSLSAEAGEITNTLTLDSYLDNFMMLNLMMGLLFELPLIAWLLGRAGVLRRGFFSRYRRHAVVALLVLAAVVTPTGDPLTLMVVFLPVYLLWEASSRLVPADDGPVPCKAPAP